MCAETAPSLPPSDRTRLVSIAEAFRAVEEQGGAASGRLPHLAPTSLLHVARAAQAFPHVPLGAVRLASLLVLPLRSLPGYLRCS